MAGCGCDDNTCGTEYSSLPTLTGCPADTEKFLVSGATGGEGVGKYGLRSWEDLIACISAQVGSPTWYKLVFKVGDVGSPIVAGDTGLIITVANPIEDSELVFLDNSPLTPEQDDRVSYTAVYSATELTINFNQAVSDGQLYYIKYQA